MNSLGKGARRLLPTVIAVPLHSFGSQGMLDTAEMTTHSGRLSTLQYLKPKAVTSALEATGSYCTGIKFRTRAGAACGVHDHIMLER